MNKLLFKLLFIGVLFTAHISYAMHESALATERKTPKQAQMLDDTKWLDKINADFQTIRTTARAYSLRAQHPDKYSKSHARLMAKLKVSTNTGDTIPAQFAYGYNRKIEFFNKAASLASITYSIVIPNDYSRVSKDDFVIIISDVTFAHQELGCPEEDLTRVLIYAALQDAWNIHADEKKPMKVAFKNHALKNHALKKVFIDLMSFNKKEKETGTTVYQVTNFTSFIAQENQKIIGRMWRMVADNEKRSQTRAEALEHTKKTSQKCKRACGRCSEYIMSFFR